MLITSTESIRIKLSSAVTTRQMNVFASYNTITATSLTPAKYAVDTNNTTAVIFLPSPSVGQQNQLRHCSIYNCDTAGNTVTVEVNGGAGTRTIFTSYLFVGEYIQYTASSGWQVYNHTGAIKNYGLAQNPTPTKNNQYFNAIASNTSATLTSGTDYAVYLGKADRSYNQVSVMYQVTTALGATVTWAELAIYKGYPSIGASTVTLTRCGFKDANFSTGQSGFTATGVKNSAVNVSGIYPGDDLWAVFGSVTTGTNMAVIIGVADDISAGFIRTVTGSVRPSTNSTITVTAQAATTIPWVAWQGFQW